MANPEHLKILKQGVEVWNRWREEHPEILPDLSDTNYRIDDFVEANLSVANFSNANLKGVYLHLAILQGVDFSRANLEDADLSSTILSNANLEGANLFCANLISVDMTGTNLSHANLRGAWFGYTTLTNTDLSTVEGLEDIVHQAPSSLGIDTLYKSGWKIPEVFLRGCGTPENFITHIHSLTGQALEFYKCFISFTEADDVFSERLYNDLQAKGVRCWRWKEDAKWGKTLMRSIDEAVRVYDKLIVICSEKSLNSPAVIREIERALQKEDDLAWQGKDAEVLFPIRLDDYIFSGWNNHRKADVIAKNVGDFRRWSEPEQYKKAFGRLIRDLKAED